ncbi:MAG: ABC-type transporter, integral rane subunit [Deltaproteobacteria bacterium]|jgi:peptide/nickel transport system permease protein/dipeptide transport system permease protein|nr:ABC-type transporter, integral rane subunit [Deltaproteobacteria bacterium]
MRNPEDRHPFFDQIEKLFKNKTGLAGLIIITLFTLAAIFAPVISPHNPIENALYDQLKPPVWEEGGAAKNLLGTDDLGRDILSRLIYGARVSLTLGVVSVGLALTLGTLLGALAGYYKGWLDNLIMRFMDIILAFPHILLAIVIVAYLGPGLRNAMMAIGIINIPRFARIVRASVMDEFGKDYVTAAKAVGASDRRVIFNAILPNCLAPMIVQASLGFGAAILDAAGLSFLGLGAQPPIPEWGAMIAEGRAMILRAWWVMTFPGIAILLGVLGFNLLGDGLRDALDPRLRD